MTQGEHGFLPGLGSVTSRWRKGGTIFIASNGRLGAGSHLRPLALFLEPRVFALELSSIAERPCALQPPLTRSLAGHASLEHPAFLRELRLALVTRPGSSKSWLRQPCFEAYQKRLLYPSLDISGTATPPDTFEVLAKHRPLRNLCSKETKKISSSHLVQS